MNISKHYHLRGKDELMLNTHGSVLVIYKGAKERYIRQSF